MRTWVRLFGARAYNMDRNVLAKKSIGKKNPLDPN
jgi:hypothetical protein